MAAMWLLAAAPTVSRVLPSLLATDNAMAGMHAQADHAMAMPGMDGMGAMPMPHAPDTPGDPLQHMDQCGYCVMLAHTPLLLGAVVALLMATPLPVVAPDTSTPASWRAQALLSAHPRGPPFVPHG